MAIELHTPGGTVDPMGKRPPIGGSMLIIVDTKEKHAVVIDSGSYHSSGENRERHAQIINEKNLEFEKRISAGEIIPLSNLEDTFHGDPDVEFSEVVASNFPNFSVLSEMDKITVIITHAHFDHVGSLVYLVRRFPKAKVYMTKPTLDMATVNWFDSLKITESHGLIPAYTTFDIERVGNETHIIDSNSVISEYPFSISFTPAGHILGAIGIIVHVNSEVGNPSFYITGDVSITHQYSVGAGQIPSEPIEYLVCEATNAGQEKKERAHVEEKIISTVRECLDNGGKALFPVLSIGRPIELMMLFHKSGILSQYSVYIDGLAQAYAKIYKEYGHALPDIERHFVTSNSQREALANTRSPHIMLASGAMINDGSRSARYAPNYIKGGKNVIIIPQYVDSCSPAFRVLSAKKGNRIWLGGKPVIVQAQVFQYGLSAHASHNELCVIHNQINPKRAFYVHGNEFGVDALKRDLEGVEKTYLNSSFRF